MDKELMEMVLPRLARRLHRQLRRFHSGELDHKQFSKKFETLLQNQYAWLSQQGVPEAEASVAIHAGVLILSSPVFPAEAEQQGVPLQGVEFYALKAAPTDVALHHALL